MPSNDSRPRMSARATTPRTLGTSVAWSVAASLLLSVTLGYAAPPSAAAADYAGTATCAGCHAKEHEAWRGSQHDRAMEEANERTVLGDFGGARFTQGGVTSRFFRRDDGSTYFAMAEVEMPEEDTEPPPLPPCLAGHLLGIAPAGDQRFTSKRIADQAHAERLMADILQKGRVE